MDKKDSNYKIPIFAAGAVFLLIIALSVGYILSGAGDKNKPKPTDAPAYATDHPTITAEPVAGSFDAIIADVDPDNSMIVLVRLGSKDFEEFIYTGATDIRTSYNKPVTASLLRPGDFVTVSYSGENRLTKLIGMSNVDVYKGVKNLRTEPDIMRMSIGDAVYRYDDSLLILNDGYFVGQETLYKSDVLSVYSIDGFVYLIKVTTGHGYLKLANDSSFIGGSLFVGTGMTVQIEKDMLLTLSEGTYAVTAKNGELKGSATMLVSRDKTAVFDLAPYSPEPVEYSNIMFSITPVYANLYIDGVLTDHSAPVPVSYGEHYVEVMLTGYTTYEGILTASKPSAALSISLSAAPVVSVNDDLMYDSNAYMTEAPAATGDPYGDIPDNTTDPDSDDYPVISGLPTTAPVDTPTDIPTDAPTDTPTEAPVKTDSGDEKLIIHCTEGTAVYINDVFKGTISGGVLTLPKPSGEFSVRLTLEGYITRHYTVSVDNDGEDAEFTFPNMVKE